MARAACAASFVLRRVRTGQCIVGLFRPAVQERIRREQRNDQCAEAAAAFLIGPIGGEQRGRVGRRFIAAQPIPKRMPHKDLPHPLRTRDAMNHVDRIVHGTTVATNALLERRGSAAM